MKEKTRWKGKNLVRARENGTGHGRGKGRKGRKKREKRRGTRRKVQKRKGKKEVEVGWGIKRKGGGLRGSVEE